MRRKWFRSFSYNIVQKRDSTVAIFFTECNKGKHAMIRCLRFLKEHKVINVALAPSDLVFLLDPKNAENQTYTPCEIYIDGKSGEGKAATKLGGHFTKRLAKKGWLFKGKFEDFEKLKSKTGATDNSYMNSVVGTDLFYSMGVPVPQVTFAQLNVKIFCFFFFFVFFLKIVFICRLMVHLMVFISCTNRWIPSFSIDWEKLEMFTRETEELLNILETIQARTRVYTKSKVVCDVCVLFWCL
jgi:hypothetical protein